MLKKMLIHGLIAAAVIAATAAVYAAGRGNGDAAESAAPAMWAETGGRDATGNGYLADDARRGERDGLLRVFRTRAHDRDDDHGERAEHSRKHRDHDDD